MIKEKGFNDPREIISKYKIQFDCDLKSKLEKSS